MSEELMHFLQGMALGAIVGLAMLIRLFVL